MKYLMSNTELREAISMAHQIVKYSDTRDADLYNHLIALLKYQEDRAGAVQATLTEDRLCGR